MADQLLYPLDGVSVVDPLQGGYAFGDWSDLGNAFHPGSDFNTPGDETDCGRPVYAAADGVVVFVRTWEETGYGYHLWYRTRVDGTDYWVHHAHMLPDFRVSVNDPVARGTLLGFCSKTGGQAKCHVHTEVRNSAPKGWSYWPTGIKDKEVALDGYIDPIGWYQQVKAHYDAQGNDEMAELTDAQRDMLSLMNPPADQPDLPNYDAAHPGLFIDADGVRKLISDRDALTAQLEAVNKQNAELWSTNAGLTTQVEGLEKQVAVAIATGEVEGRYDLTVKAEGEVVLTKVQA